MTRIESPEVALAAPADEVARGLNDWDVFGALLGQGPVSDFTHDGAQCSFKVTGGVAIHLRRSQPEVDGSVLCLNTVAPTPVKFTLNALVKPDGEGCRCRVQCDAELNPFTRMMVEPALNGLFGQMASALHARYGAA